MRLANRWSLLAVLLTVAVTGVATGSASASTTSPVVGHVYVNDNVAISNTIAGFDRHADGSLTPIAGSPFATGGAGTGVGTGSQGALQQDGRYLLAVNAGSDEISVLTIGAGGALTPVTGGTVASGGGAPVSIAVHGSLIYVANDGDASGATDYSGFRLGLFGRLTPIAGSTFTLPSGSEPGDVLFNSTGTNLVGTRVTTSEIDSFSVSSSGLLTPAGGSPFSAQGVGPFGSEFDPAAPGRLYVSNAHGGANAGTVSAFDVASDGTLSPIVNSPFADLQTAPCWVEISHDGRYLYTVNTGVSTISRYLINSDGSLTLLGSTVFNDPSGLGAFDARLSPSGRNLYVVDDGADKVSGFSVSLGGGLTELASSPTSLPAGATPFGIVVN